MGLFESKQVKQYKKEKKAEQTRDVIRNVLGLSDMSDEEVNHIEGLISHLGADQIINFPEWQANKAHSPAEKTMMFWKWLEIRQNWLILNQLAKLNKNIEKIMPQIENDGD